MNTLLERIRENLPHNIDKLSDEFVVSLDNLQSILYELSYKLSIDSYHYCDFLSSSKVNLALDEDGDHHQTKFYLYNPVNKISLPKAIKAFFTEVYKAKYDKKPDSTILDNTLNMLNQRKIKLTGMRLDFASIENLDGCHYTDFGSCMFSYSGCHRKGYYQMRDDGNFFALTLTNNNEGIGRCLIYRIDDNRIILFNAYGIYTLVNYLDTIKSLIPDLYDSKISLDCDEDVYINGDKGIKISTIKINQHSYSIEVDNSNARTIYTCWNCDCELDEDDTYTFNDRYYCEDCYGEHIGYCHNCGEDYLRDDLTYILDYDYCECCANKLFFICERCNYYYSKNDAYEFNGDLYCEDCIDRIAFYCESCDEWQDINDCDSYINESGQEIVLCDYCLSQLNLSICQNCERKYEDYYFPIAFRIPDLCLECQQDNSSLRYQLNLPQPVDSNNIPLMINV